MSAVPGSRAGGRPVLARLRDLAAIIREPVLAETRANLRRSWARVPEPFRQPQQMLGRAGNGCGATIGVMPRCDFACLGCYLGEEANRIPPEPIEAVKAQMRALRPTLGNAGNLQLTDGEVTLRPEAELIELLRYAGGLGLIPMLMTHGDSFRRRPGLLERLMVEGGLVELSIHVDITQRGRMGGAYRGARTEAELMPLRDEFAGLVRRAVRATGRPLRVATTVTVTADNLAEVPDIMRWLTRNSDAFRLLSFQPAAQVGRTVAGLGGRVTVDALWARIAEGLDPAPGGVGRLTRGQMWVGHPACNRYLAGVVAHRRGGSPTFHPLRRSGHPTDERIVDGFLRRFGGISFRLDPPAERAARWLGLVLADPRFVLGGLAPFAAEWLRRLSPGRPLCGLAGLLTGRLRPRGIVVVTHHFMSPAEAATPLGRERLALCVFHVPVGGRLVPMCEVNATDVRSRHYAGLRRSPSSIPQEQALVRPVPQEHPPVA